MSKKSTNVGVGKKVLASALSAAMVVAFAPAVAIADTSLDVNETPTMAEPESVAIAESTVGGSSKTFESFAQAVAEADDGAVVKLLSDSSETTSGVSIEKAVTIDLNGHELTTSQPSNTFLSVKATGNLVIKDSSNGARGKVKSDKGGVVCVNSGGRFKLDSGEIEGAKSNGSTLLVGKGASADIIGGKVSYKAGVIPKAVVSCSGHVSMTDGYIVPPKTTHQAIYISGTSGGSFDVLGGSVEGLVFLDYGNRSTELDAEGWEYRGK